MACKLLVIDLETALARHLSQYLLNEGHEVVGIGNSERVLGTLKTSENFSFHKMDLKDTPLVRSYLYGVSHIIITDRSPYILEKLDRLFSGLMHLKSAIPQVFLFSSSLVFPTGTSHSFNESEEPSPVHPDGDRYLGAEIMLRNYCSHMNSNGAIIRIPHVVDPAHVDEKFAEFLKLIKKSRGFLKPVDSPPLQWVHLKDLNSQVKALLEISWSGIEVFHLLSFSKEFEEAFSKLNQALGAKGSIESETRAYQAMKTLLSRSPLLQTKLQKFKGLIEPDEVLIPALDDKSSRRMFTHHEISLSEHIKGAMRKIR